MIPKQTSGVIFSLLLAVSICQSLSADAPPTVVTPSTSPPSTPPTPGHPERGSYNLTNSNGTVCLLAEMGLQLNISFYSSSYSKTVQTILNLHPNLTKSSGSCEPDSAILILMEENVTLTFTFYLNSTSNRYHLGVLELSAALPDMTKPFSVHNNSLNYLRGSLGHSYMCQKEQTLNVAQDFSLNTFQLHVQPFGVSGDQFGAAEECELDEDDMLIPIIVGAALAVLVLIVLLAYLIGRKRSHAGYQTI